MKNQMKITKLHRSERSIHNVVNIFNALKCSEGSLLTFLRDVSTESSGHLRVPYPMDDHHAHSSSSLHHHSHHQGCFLSSLWMLVLLLLSLIVLTTSSTAARSLEDPHRNLSWEASCFLFPGRPSLNLAGSRTRGHAHAHAGEYPVQVEHSKQVNAGRSNERHDEMIHATSSTGDGKNPVNNKLVDQKRPVVARWMRTRKGGDIEP